MSKQYALLNSEKLLRRVIILSWFTILYNLVEGAFSIFFGLEHDSVSLAGFGVDSFIEVASAFLVLWRFRGETGRGPELSINRERRATLGIGILFSVLGLITILASGNQLWTRSHPENTIAGLVISTLSLSFMFYLWKSKSQLATALDSGTVKKDADCSLACIKLSIILFMGSLLFLMSPTLWWADSIAGIGLGILISREGWETIEAARKDNFEGGCGCGP